MLFPTIVHTALDELAGTGGAVSGRLLVTGVVVLLSFHLWVVRHLLAPAAGALLSRSKRTATGKTSKMDPISARFQCCWQEARISQFKTVTTIGTHAAGLVMVTFVSCTDIVSTTMQGRLGELPLLWVFACNYALLLINYCTLDGITHRRIDVFYFAFLLLATFCVLYIETGPSFFMFRGNDALAQGMLALVVLDVRRSCVGGAIYATCCCVSFVRSTSAFQQNLLIERHTELFVCWVWALWLFSCGVAYSAEYYFKARIRATLETEDVQEALLRVLSALCDSVVHLDSSLRVQRPSLKLLHMLAPDASGNPSSLQGKPLTTFMPSEEDRRRFLQLTSSSASGERQTQSPGGGRPAAATHVQLRDCRGAVFRVELFHTHLHGAAPTHQHHLIGIRCVSVGDEYAEDRQGDFDPGGLGLPRPCSLEVCCSEGSEAGEAKSEKSENFAEPPPPSEARSHRTEAESTLGGATECGRTLVAELWRCPRCGATRQDWGDVISIASGGGSVGNDSVAYRAGRALPSLRTAPPGTGHGDLQTLFEWAPEVCRDVVPEAAATYRLVHNAALSLEGQEHVQYTQAVEQTIVDLLLVGLKLEQEWSGLRQGWHNVVSFVVGAHPVPLRRLVRFEPGAGPAEAPQQQVA
jgi:hypothetical protein